ncbi:CC-NBS-LRR resistance protein, partial [Trifolium pratense]
MRSLERQISLKMILVVPMLDVIQVQGKGSFNRIGYLPPLDGETSSSSTRGGEKYETRETFKENIMNALAHHNSCNIGVYGLGGVGKTTLVGEVFEISKKQKLFDAVVKTHVTKNPDIKTIQGEIADLLGLRFDEETILGRAHRLRQRIKMEKNILIVLDDIWTILDLNKVGIPFGNQHNGCKLLMTSRNKDVLLQMDVPKDFTFKLELMSEDETWSLFQFMAGDVVKDRNLQGLAIEVAQKCAGLPLVVVAVARALKDKWDVESWKDELTRLQSDHYTVFSALKLSYDSLESDQMKDIFLLFAVMADEDVRYFLKVAMGLKIFKHIDTVDEARNRLSSIIRSLEAACLLLEDKTSGEIQMHDFVREFAISIARRDKHVFLKKQSDEECPSKSVLT